MPDQELPTFLRYPLISAGSRATNCLIKCYQLPDQELPTLSFLRAIASFLRYPLITCRIKSYQLAHTFLRYPLI
ncbi:hypothetical protein, partial [Cronobacter sakazakii]|uniref:hypothetical protein n=1 Tax=Cronobacter sakazakii TaxID=28141 RepID=UPI001F452125